MANKNPTKPKKTHPWKTTSQLVPTEISKWANESSTNAHVFNYKLGGGKPQK